MKASGGPGLEALRPRDFTLVTGPARSQEEARAKKEAEKAAKAATAALMEGMIIQPKLKPGQDPKSVLCEFFRHGKCKKGDNCKYSHDRSVEIARKGPKIDLFTDQRQDCSLLQQLVTRNPLLSRFSRSIVAPYLMLWC